MVTNKKTSLGKHALALFSILLNCPSYVSSDPTLVTHGRAAPRPCNST